MFFADSEKEYGESSTAAHAPQRGNSHQMAVGDYPASVKPILQPFDDDGDIPF